MRIGNTNNGAIPSNPSVLPHSLEIFETFKRSGEYRTQRMTQNTSSIPVDSNHHHRGGISFVLQFLPAPLSPVPNNPFNSLPAAFSSPRIKRGSYDQHHHHSPPQEQHPQHHIPVNMNHRYHGGIFNRRYCLDDLSHLSPLQCGSIRPDPGYSPELDPANRTFIPPIEITIRIKQPIPDWLKLDADSTMKRQSEPLPRSAIPTLDRHRSAPTATTRTRSPSRQGLCKQVSFRSRPHESSAPYLISGKPMITLPLRRRNASNLSATNISVGSTVGQCCSSLHTSPTELSSDAGSQPMEIVPERKSLVRTELKHFISRIPLFNRKDFLALKRARGCLA
jgi:hypothetical protein